MDSFFSWSMFTLHWCFCPCSLRTGAAFRTLLTWLAFLTLPKSYWALISDCDWFLPCTTYPTEFLCEEKAVLYSDAMCALALALAVLTVLGLLPPLMRSVGIGGLLPARLLSFCNSNPYIGISTISIFDLIVSFLVSTLLALLGVTNIFPTDYLLS